MSGERRREFWGELGFQLLLFRHPLLMFTLTPQGLQ